MSNDIEYTGPNNQYIPPSGDHVDTQSVANLGLGPTSTYANVNYLNTILAALIAQAATLQTTLTNALQTISLAVTTSANDFNLNSAHEVLWPSTLGPAPAYISFLYYQSLQNNNSAAAKTIRAAYEAAARGVTGNDAIDLLPIVQMTLTEADLIQTFAEAHAGDLSDSSQKRSVELLQDWVEAATVLLNDVETQFINQASSTLDATDVSQLSSTDATNTQAVMQVNMNQLNVQLTKSMGVLQQFFATYQSTFYNNVLGPAVSFRNNVTTSLLPTLPPSINSIIGPSTNILNTQLTAVIADQMRRNDVYVSRVNDILTTVQARDNYRSYIIQLSATGQTITAGTSGTMVSSTDTPDQAAYFQAATAPAATPNNPYLAPHNQLSGLDDPAAHAQYIDRFGDIMIGNLDLVAASDDNPNGALIDGMKPSTHAHTGKDGTVQIHGADIIGGSLISTVVDTTNQPTAPSGITLVNQYIDDSSGSPTIDVSISWTGDDSYTYEVQIAKVTS